MKPVQCTICQEWVRNENCLRMHNKRKHVEKKIEPVSCDICGSWHETKARLQKHIRYNHKTKRDLQCNFCDKTFKIKINLVVSSNEIIQIFL